LTFAQKEPKLIATKYLYLNMFDSKAKVEAGRKEAETFIGPSVKVEGDFVGEGNLVVEGIVVGNLATKNDLTIGKDAVIEAEIKARNAFIAGRVKGNVSIKGKLQLTSTAQIIGNVKTAILSVESGGLINGQLIMVSEAEKVSPDKEELSKNKK